MFNAPRPGIYPRPAGPERSPIGKTKPNKANSINSKPFNQVERKRQKQSQLAYASCFQMVKDEKGAKNGPKLPIGDSSMNCGTFWQRNGYIGRFRRSKTEGGEPRARGRTPNPEWLPVALPQDPLVLLREAVIQDTDIDAARQGVKKCRERVNLRSASPGKVERGTRSKRGASQASAPRPPGGSFMQGRAPGEVSAIIQAGGSMD